MLLYVECTIINMTTYLPLGKYVKNFDMIGDFNSWYKIAKDDPAMILNIMKYNPIEYPSLKTTNDIKLLGVSRELPL